MTELLIGIGIGWITAGPIIVLALALARISDDN
jgi:hypothetical protein